MRLWLAVLAGAVVLVLFELPRPTVGSAVASVLVCAVLALAIARSAASGPPLIVALAGLLFVTSWLINIPEGVLFEVIEPGEAAVGLARELIASIATVTVMVGVAGRLGAGGGFVPEAGSIRSAGALLWRLAAVPVVFVLCYFAAGLIIYPFVQPYYEGIPLPDPLAIVSMQVLRSLAIVGAAFPLLMTLDTRKDAVALLALALPVFGAVAPLLPANEAMPGTLRLVHALETVPYYALFGALVAVWFGPPRRRPETAVREAVAAG